MAKAAQKPQILVVLGPTSSGKSDLAVLLAKHFNGEVISADSRQVYKGLDIGTGKITNKEMKGVPHYLLDVAHPKSTFSVSQFKSRAEKAIATILKKNKLPILCGGTGFYIDAVVNNQILPNVPPSKTLRKELAKKTTSELFKILSKLDNTRAKTIDAHNPVRLIRAIEIATALGKVPKVKTNKPYNTLFIGIAPSEEVLKIRIHTRLLKRMKQGMVAEAKKLHDQGLSFKRMEDLGLEYKYLALLLQKKISKEEFLVQLETAIWHYVKRQITWFKRNKEITWFTAGTDIKIQELVQSFLHKS